MKILSISNLTHNLQRHVWNWLIWRKRRASFIPSKCVQVGVNWQIRGTVVPKTTTQKNSFWQWQDSTTTYTSRFLSMETTNICNKHKDSSTPWWQKWQNMAPHTNNHLPQTVLSCCTSHNHYPVGGEPQSVLSTVFEHIRQWTYYCIRHKRIQNVSFFGKYYSDGTWYMRQPERPMDCDWIVPYSTLLETRDAMYV